ncbi:MAG: HDIG domain-containing protein [Clostridiales bacterium]|nr:HDIG domain-containing protein [Clostridiales bacterium]MCF8021443.1 HDIG domain-containing protein [Clostridiales bacterium]
MVSPGQARKNFLNLISALIRKRKMRRGLAAVLFFVLLTFIISVDYGSQKVNIEVGQVASRDIPAPRSIVIRNDNKTTQAKQEARESIEKQYEEVPEITNVVQKDVSSFISSIKNIQKKENMDKEEKLKKINSLVKFPLSEKVLSNIVNSSPQRLDRLETEITSLIVEVMNEGVTFKNKDRAIKSLVGKVEKLDFKDYYTALAEGIIREYIRPNNFYDQEKTNSLQEAAMDAVPTVMVTVKKDETIVEEGDVVSKQDMEKLKALGLTDNILPVKYITGIAMMVALLMIVVLFYLYQQNRKIYKNPGQLYLIGLIILGVLAVSKGIMAIDINQWPQLDLLFAYMSPLAAAGMLIAILLDSRLAVLVVAVMSFFLGVMTGGEIRFAVVGLIGGITGVYSVSKLSQRGDLARAGIYVSIANILSILAMELVSSQSMGLIITSSLGMGIINGLLSSIFTNGALPYLESTFSITSAFHLLELSHPSNSLLRRLLTEAPGTYYHSILVGNLAESAAGEIGGEPLLARVGAYYHDIGKLKRPLFFIENQMGNENPHDKIAPSLSTLIITSHVKDGVEMAREAKLPSSVIDIIEQHHGNTLCSYFYQVALETGRSENISEEDFRHDGPKPQSKEAALVMLADSVEAAVRALKNRTPGKVEGTVRKVIKDKLMDGQLDECDLTFKDLDITANSFLQVLSGILHSRIEYPDVAEIERRKNKNGSARKKLAGKSTGKK